MKNIVLTLLFLLLVLPFSAANHNLTKIDVTKPHEPQIILQNTGYLIASQTGINI